ncbi:MAG: terminase, partial [Bacteroidales bacterium]|nr:terminase [Bacteroidales bacterium]
MTTEEILVENQRRRAALFADVDPVSGEGSVGERREVEIAGVEPRRQWVPVAMLDDSSVADILHTGRAADATAAERWERARIRHDFPYWAARYVYIKRKGGGDDCLFRLTYPQRKFVARLEELRLANKPIRIVLLKARQWGGSTTSQLYMAWLQLVHCTGLNSLIIAHQGTGSDEIKDMFDRMVRAYPARLLHPICEHYEETEAKLVGVGKTRSIFRVPQRNCKIKIGTAERPDSCRGGDYNLVHLSEVGLWKATQGKKPEDIIRAACGGVLYKPMTMLIYESTANGIGNFFHREYIDARDNPRSQFRALFIAWHEIEQNTLPFESEAERQAFAESLIDNREQPQSLSNREESGRYLWWLWEIGATLEGINWYMMERAKHSQHGSMAAECPSDDTEAFVNSGAAVFDKYQVEALRPACRKPAWIGDVSGPVGTGMDMGPDALIGLEFREDAQGQLWVWALPSEESLTNRYVAVVDIGGRSYKADWSVIVVIDRLPMASGGKPEVVAQWYGHIDMDLLAWKAAQIAAFYGEALLVIESNTLETRDPLRQVDGDQSHFILNQIKDAYPNLYARRQSAEDIRQGMPRKYGFHTNIATKPMIISTMVKVVRDGLYVERDERCLNELLVYERKPNGSYGAIIGAHDDLLMTRAIGLHIAYYEMDLPSTPIS